MAPKSVPKPTPKAAKVEAAPKAKTAAAKVAPKAAAAKEEVEDKKRKAEEKAADTAPKKEAKTEEPKKAKEDEVTGEKEQDAPADKRQALKDTVTFLPADTTLNVVPTMGGKVLMSLSEGGMQYMIAGARANVGIKAGRYMYEVKIIEALNPAESSGAQRGRVPMPRQLVRLGFSTAEAGLILGDAEDGIFFDAEGNYAVGKTKKPAVAQRFTRDQVMAVVLNLDPKSPNNNTISLFKEGERICEPQPLPESLHGKTLYPHVSFRSVTVQMGFGHAPAKALPFSCRGLQAAAQADVDVRPDTTPKDGKCEVLVPVAFPDEGTFDWLDGFLAKNPQYVEISDRKILEWAEASGVWRPKSTGMKNSNDKPEFNFGLPGMDDTSIRKVLYNILPHVPRNYVIMEVKSNLVKDERAEILKRFSAPHFKKVATVIMGQPNDEYKEKRLQKMLQEKQEKADVEFKAKKAEEERKKQVALRQKQLADMRKKAEEQRKKVLEEAKKKREAEVAKKEAEKKKKEKEAAKKKKADEKAKKAAERQAKVDAGEEVPDEEEEPEEEEEAEPEDEAIEEEKKEEDVKEEVKEEETKDEEMKDEDADEASPQVELTEDEKKEVFRKPSATSTPDLTTAVLNQSFGQFSCPEKAEGFDEVRYEWEGHKESAEYLRKWVVDRKLNSRIEDLQPSDWFKEKHVEWIKVFAEWQKKQKAYQLSPAKKAKDAAAKKREAAAKKAEADGTTLEEEDAEMEVDIDAVENLSDVGNGEPLYAGFTFEDWALLQLRMEMYFLQHAFRKDVNDDDRPGVLDQHLAYYYTKYFRKTLNPKHFNVASNKELCELVKDTVKIHEDTNVLTSVLAEETETFDVFVKLTEENRRERQRRLDAGDETVKVKFSPLAVQQPQAAKAAGAAAPKPTGTAGAAVPKPAGATGAFSFTPRAPVAGARPVYGRLTPGVVAARP